MTLQDKAARKAIQDKLESQIKSFEAELGMLRARAEAAKANAEINAVARLATRRLQLQVKLHELKHSADSNWERTRKHVESMAGELEKDIKNIEAKVHIH